MDSVEAPEEEVAAPDNVSPTIMPVLYQILDTIGELKTEVKSFTNDAIGAVIRNMQPTQPQVSPEMQLMNSFIQNPEGFLKLVEISEKMNKGKK